MSDKVQKEILMMYELAGDKDLKYYEAIQRIIDYIAELEQDFEEEKRINQEDLKLIDELQQENERLKENAIHNDKVVDKAGWNEMDYKTRNEKAIEYIEWSNYEMVNDNKKFFNYLDKLLNILRGDNK